MALKQPLFFYVRAYHTYVHGNGYTHTLSVECPSNLCIIVNVMHLRGGVAPTKLMRQERLSLSGLIITDPREVACYYIEFYSYPRCSALIARE